MMNETNNFTIPAINCVPSVFCSLYTLHCTCTPYISNCTYYKRVKKTYRYRVKRNFKSVILWMCIFHWISLFKIIFNTNYREFISFQLLLVFCSLSHPFEMASASVAFSFGMKLWFRTRLPKRHRSRLWQDHC